MAVTASPEIKSPHALVSDNYPASGKADQIFVSKLLSRCKTKEDVFKMADELRDRGGWREEFALMHQAAKKFPEAKKAFQEHQTHMATSRRIQNSIILGKHLSNPEELLRIEL